MAEEARGGGSVEGARPQQQQQEPSLKRKSPHDGASDGATNATKLFLGGLSWHTTEDKLRATFSRFGDVEDVAILLDKETRNPRGFGFVKFSTVEAAKRAIAAGPHHLDDRLIDAKPSVPVGQLPPGRALSHLKVFVGGLSPMTTEDELREYFLTFGPVLEAHIMMDPVTNRSRGFGFVTFEDEASVYRTFATGPMHQLSGKMVEVKAATPKGSGPMGSAAPLTPWGYAVPAAPSLGWLPGAHGPSARSTMSSSGSSQHHLAFAHRFSEPGQHGLAAPHPALLPQGPPAAPTLLLPPQAAGAEVNHYAAGGPWLFDAVPAVALPAAPAGGVSLVGSGRMAHGGSGMGPGPGPDLAAAYGAASSHAPTTVQGYGYAVYSYPVPMYSYPPAVGGGMMHYMAPASAVMSCSPYSAQLAGFGGGPPGSLLLHPAAYHPPSAAVATPAAVAAAMPPQPAVVAGLAGGPLAPVGGFLAAPTAYGSPAYPATPSPLYGHQQPPSPAPGWPARPLRIQSAGQQQQQQQQPGGAGPVSSRGVRRAPEPWASRELSPPAADADAAPPAGLWPAAPASGAAPSPPWQPAHARPRAGAAAAALGGGESLGPQAGAAVAQGGGAAAAPAEAKRL